jgi:hypothetical protein
MAGGAIAYQYGVAVWVLAYLYSWLRAYDSAMEQAKNFTKESMPVWVFNVATWNVWTLIGLILVIFLLVWGFQRIIIDGIVDTRDSRKSFAKYAMQSFLALITDAQALQGIYSIIILATILVVVVSWFLPKRLFRDSTTANRATAFVYVFVMLSTVSLILWIAWSRLAFR